MKIWMDGDFVDRDAAKVSVFDHGLLYGDGCFEGIRAYGGRIFKLGAHLRRMYESADKLRLKPVYPHSRIAAAIRQTIEVNGLSDAYIRLIFTRGVGTLGLHPFKCPVSGTIIIADHIQLYPPELYETGIKLGCSRHVRQPDETILDPTVKSNNYLNNVLALLEGNEGTKYMESIILTRDGFVAEGTVDNLFLVRAGDLPIMFDHAFAYRHRNRRGYKYRDLTWHELTGVINLLFTQIAAPPPSFGTTRHRASPFSNWDLMIEQRCGGSLAIDDRARLW